MQDQETKRTIVYVLVAGMALLVAWEPWYRVPEEQSAPSEAGTKLFPKFTDPLSAASLEVLRYDEATSTIRPFKVAKVNGVWSIPSHSNYPADAREHMAEAATALLGIEILGVASTSPGDQELYGVVAPDPQKLRQGATGVGTQIILKDAKGDTLADLIVGKEVKDKPELRYVRRADRDQIFPVAIKTDKLSTKFEDWIEKDLLKLNAFDVREVALNDYSLEEGVTPQGGIGLRMHPRSKMDLRFDDSKSAWTLVDMSEFDEKGQPVVSKLAEDEELNSEKLNNLKSALDDLQIVDVERKPKGLSQDLRASEEFVKDNEAKASLITRGFYPIPRDGQVEIFSSEGEATCTTKDGVRYVLRFGHLAGGEDPMAEEPEKEKKDEKKSNPALNRFLFVMAQYDDTQIAKPKLEPLPGEAAEGDATTEAKEGEKPAEAKPEDADAKPAADAKGEETKVPEEKTAAQDDKAEPAAEKNTATDEKAEEKKGDKKEAAPATPEEEKILAIKRENKRRQDEYNDAVKKGQDKVKELNDRFADWYFTSSIKGISL